MKPLTKEERELIADVARKLDPQHETLNALLSDSAFWREAVKSLPQFGNEDRECLFCQAEKKVAIGEEITPHDPDCPWKLANE